MRACLVTAALGVAVWMGVVAHTSEAARPAAKDLRALQGVNFVGSCTFSHMAMDDPIVYPGQPGSSHDHSFVGNTTTGAFSTLATLRAGSTTCKRNGETAAYWMPTLLLNGQMVTPRGATIYYRRKSLAPVTPFPAGFKLIAGDRQATSPQGMKITYWNCGAASTVPASTRSRPARTPEARACACTSRSRAAGTGTASTARITRATWHMRPAVPAPRLIRLRCRRSR